MLINPFENGIDIDSVDGIDRIIADLQKILADSSANMVIKSAAGSAMKSLEDLKDSYSVIMNDSARVEKRIDCKVALDFLKKQMHLTEVG